MTDFDPSRVRTRSASIAWSINYRGRCDSTQDIARAAILEGAQSGWTVVTDEQLAGRGRHGRSWVAPFGSALLFSTALRVGADSALLPLLAGIAVAEGIERSTGFSPELKWPNDLLHDGRKVAGILVERPSDTWVIVGVGINVNAQRSKLPEQASSLQDALGRPLERESLLASILDAFEEAITRTSKDGRAWIFPAWRRRSRMLGQRVTFQQEGQIREGVAEDLAEDGALVVRLDDGRRLSLVAGDVRQVRPI